MTTEDNIKRLIKEIESILEENIDIRTYSWYNQLIKAKDEDKLLYNYKIDKNG